MTNVEIPGALMFSSSKSFKYIFIYTYNNDYIYAVIKLENMLALLKEEKDVLIFLPYTTLRCWLKAKQSYKSRTFLFLFA